jgi:hypothetical protein
VSKELFNFVFPGLMMLWIVMLGAGVAVIRAWGGARFPVRLRCCGCCCLNDCGATMMMTLGHAP